MTEGNLQCDVTNCGRVACAFGIKGTVKEKCCDAHLLSLSSEEMTIIGIDGYRFISSFEDAAEFEERKTRTERGIGFLSILEVQCDTELFEAERELDASERKVSESVTRCFREIKLQVNRKFETAKQELVVLRSHYNQYLASKNNKLPESARLLCEGLDASLKWIGLMNGDCSADVCRAISRSWRMSAEDVETTLACLSAEKRPAFLERLEAEAGELLKEGRAQLSLQISLYARALGWSEEARRASLNKRVENHTYLRSLLPGFEKDLVAECVEVAVTAKNKERLDESVQWLQKAWSLSSGTAEASAVGLVMGEVLGLCCGKYTEAEEIMRQCYNSSIQSLYEGFIDGGEGALKASLGIAGLYYHSGRWDEVAEVCEWVLSSFGSSYPAEHLWTAVLYLTFSCWHQGSGDKAHRVAEEWSGKQLRGESALSESLKQTVFARNAMQRNSAEAEKMFIRALTTLQDPALAACIQHQLGDLYYDLKRWSEAEECYKRAQKIYSAVSPQSIDSADNLNNMGLLYKALERWGEAEECYKRAQQVYDAVSPLNIRAANNLNNMGLLYKTLKRWSEAEEHYNRAQQIYGAVSPQSINAAINLNNMGILFKVLERWSEAEEHYNRAQQIYGAVSPQSIDAANNLYNMGVLCEAISRRNEAIEYFIAAKNIYSINHSDAAARNSEMHIQRLRP